MIITRTPFRISFFGGGTDYPDWYNNNGGMVLSTSIDKYCYIVCRYLPPFFDYNFRIRYRLLEEVKNVEEIQHPSVRECLRFFRFTQKNGVEIQHNADLPAMSGLGSSSAFTVGLLHALYALRGKMVAKRQLASEAILVEQKMIQENVGSQDQVATSFGGFNKIIFNKQGFEVNPMVINQRKSSELQDNLMLFFVGFPRSASEIAAEQVKNISANQRALSDLVGIVERACAVLSDGGDNLQEFGKLLHENWLIKRSLAGNITNKTIDDIYAAALGAGATGGKLLGAGSGGFMLIFAKPSLHQRIREVLKNLLYVPFHFEQLGSQIIFYSHDDYANTVE